MQIRRCSILLALWTVTLALTAPSAWAQFNSAIHGVVTDTSQGVVEGARVAVTNMGTGTVRETFTTAEGVYRALSLGPGVYRVQVELPGFRTTVRDQFNLGINETARVDFTLEVGELAERVTVSERAPLVETEEGRVSGRIERLQLRELPLNGRNLFNLLALQPGVIGTPLSSGIAAGGFGGDSFSASLPRLYANGQRHQANSYTVDDTSVDSGADSGLTTLNPNAESVEEMRVVVNNFSAVDGRNSGAHIQVVTRSGNNEFHGGASYYFQNDAFAARTVFEREVAPFRRNEPGYHVGGPIIRNRTFFFHSYEGLRQSGARAFVTTVETPALREMVLRTRPNSIAALLLREFKPIVDATANLRDVGSPLPGVNQIGPPDGIADLGSATYVPDAYRNGNQFSLRIDHELRPGKDRLYGMMYRVHAETLFGLIRPAFNRPLAEPTHFASVNHTHTFSPTQLNELRVGIARRVGKPAVPNRLDIPAINILGSTGFGTNSFPQGWFQNNYHYKDVFSWVRSAHSLQMGGELRHQQLNSRNTTNYIPAYTFASILDFVDDEPLQAVRKVDPRTGDPAVNVMGIRRFEWAFFLNDDWKVSRNLTLNVGVRYENFGTPREVNGLLRNLVFGSGASYSERLAAARVDIVPELFPMDNRNWAPRIGVAWNPDGKGRTAIRAGYGISYDRPFNAELSVRDNPPLRADATLGLRFGTTFTYALGDTSKPNFGHPVDPGLRLGLDSRNGIAGARVALNTFDPNFKAPYVHNFFFGIQRELIGSTMIEVNYIGSAGHRLYNNSDVNRFRGDLLDGRFDGFNPSFASVNMYESTSNSIHHGGTVQVKRQFASGFMLQGAYTFGKTIEGGSSTYLDAGNRRLDRALAGFDVPQKLSIVGLWEIPVLRSGSGLAPKLLGGWQLTGFAILQKGTPFTVTHNGAWPRGDFNADGVNFDRPNAPAASVLRHWSRSDYLTGVLSTTDFPVPSSGSNGNLGPNTFRGPGFAQVDLALAKKFRITERIAAQLRLESYNAFNRVNLTNPGTDLNSPTTFGRSLSSLTPRVLQVGLRVTF